MGGYIVSHSERNFAWTGGGQVNNFQVALNTQAIVTVNGSQSIEIQYLSGGGPVVNDERHGCGLRSEKAAVTIDLIGKYSSTSFKVLLRQKNKKHTKSGSKYLPC